MDAKKALKKYLGANSVVCVIGWVLAAVTVCMVVLAALASTEGRDEATRFHPLDSKSGSYVYLDVVGVSEWLYKVDSAVYYTAEDAEGYVYTVRLSNTEYNTMWSQRRYWDRESDDVEIPLPHRIYGVAQKISIGAKSNLCEVWGLTSSEYEDYFGTLYLNATTTPNEEKTAMYGVFALFSGMFALIILIVVMTPSGKLKKCLRRLEQNGQLERAAEQLESQARYTVGKDIARLSEEYIYGKGTGVVVRYDDIVWCYKQTIRRNFVVTNSNLLICTADLEKAPAIMIGGSDKNNEIEQALVMIGQKNPMALLGYSQENQKAYREWKKAMKQAKKQ